MKVRGLICLMAAGFLLVPLAGCSVEAEASGQQEKPSPSPSATGPRQEVPDVTNLDGPAAERALEDAGFEVKFLYKGKPTSGLVDTTNVVSQLPKGGERAPEGSTVAINGMATRVPSYSFDHYKTDITVDMSTMPTELEAQVIMGKIRNTLDVGAYDVTFRCHDLNASYDPVIAEGKMPVGKFYAVLMGMKPYERKVDIRSSATCSPTASARSTTTPVIIPEYQVSEDEELINVTVASLPSPQQVQMIVAELKRAKADGGYFVRVNCSTGGGESFDNRLANGKFAVGTLGQLQTGLQPGGVEVEMVKGATCPAG